LLVVIIAVVHAAAAIRLGAGELQQRGDSPSSVVLSAPAASGTPVLRGGRARDTDHFAPLALLGPLSIGLEPPAAGEQTPPSSPYVWCCASSHTPLASRPPPLS